jgi:hypothetical protein
MNELKAYSSQNFKNKISYLLSKLDSCSLLDLNYCLYFLDEESIKTSGVPFTWQSYRVCEIGPICNNLHMEFIEGIRFKNRGEALGLSGFITCSGSRWKSKVSLSEMYEEDPSEIEISYSDMELIDILSITFNDNIRDNSWLFSLVGTLYHKYSQEQHILNQWEAMIGRSYSMINWIEYIDTPAKKIAYKDSFMDML